MSDKIQFQPAHIEENIRARTPKGASTSLTARNDLTRYYDSIGLALSEIELTEAEARVICERMGDLIRQKLYSRDNICLMCSFDQSDASKWGVDPAEVNEKMGALTPFQHLAILDAVERFWLNPTAKDALLKVGLLRPREKTESRGMRKTRSNNKAAIEEQGS
jgi:hypothetical protein